MTRTITHNDQPTEARDPAEKIDRGAAGRAYLTRDDALDWAVAKLGLAPTSRRPRVILTTAGLAVLRSVSRLDDVAIDWHWSVIADVLAGEPADELAEFRGFELDGHQLAFAADQIPRATAPTAREVS